MGHDDVDRRLIPDHPVDSYSALKTLHVIGASILLGTGIGIAFFCWFGARHAVKRADIGSLRTVLRFTVVADTVFTAPAVLLQLATGVLLLRQLGWSIASPWSITALALFAGVGACWLPVVWIQIRLSRIAESTSAIDRLPGRFAQLLRLWFWLGVPAFAQVICLVYLMVAKPLPVA